MAAIAIKPGTLPSDEMITLKLNAAAIILAGVRQIESWERVWEAVGEAWRPVTGLRRKVPSWLRNWNCRWTSGPSSPIASVRLPMREICKLSSLKDFEICRLLWALLILGVVIRVAPGRS